MNGGSYIQFHDDGVGVSPKWQSNRCWILLLILCPGPFFGMLIWQALCLWLGQWRWFVRASFHGWLAALLAMVPDGLRCDRGTVEALLAHQAQLVVHHLQMVDDSSPHPAPLSHTTGNGSPHWNNGGHLDGGCQLGPWLLVTLRGTLGGRISTHLAGSIEHSWCTAVHAAQSKFPWSHRFQSLVGRQTWSCSRKLLPYCKKSSCWSAGGFLGSNPLSPFTPIWNPCWRLPGNSLTRLYGGAFPPSALNGGLLGSLFGSGLQWGWRLHSAGQVVLPLSLWHYRSRGRRSLWGRFLLRGIPPGECSTG